MVLTVAVKKRHMCFFMCVKRRDWERVMVWGRKTYLPGGSVLLLKLLNHLQWEEQNTGAWCKAARFLISFLIPPDRIHPGLCCCNPLAQYPPMFNMLMSPTKCIIRQADLADGLATVSKKTDVSTLLFKISVCFSTVNSPSIQQHVCICVSKRSRGGIVSRADELYPSTHFPACKRRCTADDNITLSLPRRPNIKEAFLCLNCQNDFSTRYFFQPDNDLFLSSTVPYLAYLSKLDRKIIIWCGGCFSALLMLLCPWLSSLLFNSLRLVFVK